MLARILSNGKWAASPVAMEAAVTTNSGLKRKTKPTTMTSTPINGHRFTTVCMTMRSLNARCGAITAGCEQRVHSMKVACSPARFLLLTWKVERQWRQLCCLGAGGVQQEKLLLQTNKFCG